MKPAELIFLHTAPVHVATFDQLVRELAPGTPVRHLVHEQLLDEARRNGITTALQQQIAQIVAEACPADPSVHTAVLVCTCSTIGHSVEQAGAQLQRRIVRVDQAMAEHALTMGRRITIIAALASTLEPTRQLFESVAARHGATITMNEVLCEAAWTHFEQGDLAAYHTTIATCLRQAAATEASDVIVLAQASMAGAALLCTDLAIPILSSPRLGVEAALEQH